MDGIHDLGGMDAQATLAPIDRRVLNGDADSLH